MKFIIIITILVALFVAGAIVSPYVPDWVDSIIPKPQGELDAWIDVDTVEYDAGNCTLSFEWAVNNNGDTAYDIKVEIKVSNGDQGVVRKETIEIGTIEGKDDYFKKSIIENLCAGEEDVTFTVDAEVVDYLLTKDVA